jgi:hypothetical protein
MTTTHAPSVDITTNLTDNAIACRVEAFEEYERFSVFEFKFKDEAHVERVLAAVTLSITSADGSVYAGYVEDWNDSHYFVNLR